MIRYFNANVEDAIRIAVIEAATEDDIYSAPEASGDREIPASDLPADFQSWQRYTAHAYDDGVVVEVLSRDGD